jgi:hypothetical protein
MYSYNSLDRVDRVVACFIISLYMLNRGLVACEEEKNLAPAGK